MIKSVVDSAVTGKTMGAAESHSVGNDLQEGGRGSGVGVGGMKGESVGAHNGVVVAGREC